MRVLLPPMTQEKKQFNLRLSAELFDRLTQRSQVTNISMNQLVVDALRECLEATEGHDKGEIYYGKLMALDAVVRNHSDRLKRLEQVFKDAGDQIANT